MMRKEADMLRLFPEYLKGEELFGLTVHAVLRIAESVGPREGDLLSAPGNIPAGKGTAGHTGGAGVAAVLPLNPQPLCSLLGSCPASRAARTTCSATGAIH